MIPNKNLFIITSSLKSSIGVYDDEQRFEQTILTLKSLKTFVPEAKIVFADVSVRTVSHYEKQEITKYCDIYMDMSEEPNTRYCAINGLKSHGENCLLAAVLLNLKQNPELSNILKDVKRIFKLSSRSQLEESFNIKEYEGYFGKFIFKKKIDSWFKPGSYLLITRMFSLCPSLIDVYLQTIQKNLNNLSNRDVPDNEHAHFLNIPPKYLVEFERLHVWGWLAGNGEIEHY